MGAIEETFQRFGIETMQIIQSNMASTGTDASGETSRSLASESNAFGVKVTGKPFINVVETGRKAGGMPPVNRIQEWVDIRGIDVSAWAIAKTIAKKGSKLYREGGRTDIITPAISDKRINDLAAEIADVTLNLVVQDINDYIDGVTRDNK